MAAESKKELAQDRTDWAHERTISRLLGSVESPWIARILGVVLILTGSAIYVLGFLSYRKALKKLAEEGVRGTSLWIIGLVTLALLQRSAGHAADF